MVVRIINDYFVASTITNVHTIYLILLMYNIQDSGWCKSVVSTSKTAMGFQRSGILPICSHYSVL